MSVRAIDLWVNVNMGTLAGTEFLVRVKEDYFKAGDDFFKNLTPDQTIEAMEKAGVEASTRRCSSFPSSSPGASSSRCNRI